MMRKCTVCKVEKPLSEFNNSKRCILGKSYQCRECNKVYHRKHREKYNAIRKQRYQDNKSEFTSVYYLPEEHYIGITNNIKTRMWKHDSLGRIVDGFEIIARFNRTVDAMYLEVMFHQRGYNGSKY